MSYVFMCTFQFVVLTQDEGSWKSTLTESSSLEDVLAASAAPGSLSSLDGAEVEVCLQTLKQAGTKLGQLAASKLVIVL